MNENFGLLGKLFKIGFVTVLITSLLNEILPSPWRELNNIILLIGGFLFLGSLILFGISIVYLALVELKNFLYRLVKNKIIHWLKINKHLWEE